MIPLGKALEINKTITFLGLDRNNIGSRGFSHLYKSLQKNISIIGINMENKEIESIIIRNKKIRENVIKTAIFIIGIRMYANKNQYGIGYFIWLPKDIVKIIAQKILDTRSDNEWLSIG
jgi:hypothetical protein